MNKLLRRMIVSGISLMLGISCITPIAFAVGVDEIPNDSVIQLEYDEYISSQDYFTDLAKKGYTLVVHVGEENENAELARIASESDPSPDMVHPSPSRELTIPIYSYDVMKNGKKTISGSCDNSLGYLFTNYIYYGCPSYEVSLYNRGDDTLKVDLVPENETTAFLSYKIPAESTVIKYVTEPAWYGRFKNPCSVSGYVTRDL